MRVKGKSARLGKRRHRGRMGRAELISLVRRLDHIKAKVSPHAYASSTNPSQFIRPWPHPDLLLQLARRRTCPAWKSASRICTIWPLLIGHYVPRLLQPLGLWSRIRHDTGTMESTGASVSDSAPKMEFNLANGSRCWSSGQTCKINSSARRLLVVALRKCKPSLHHARISFDSYFCILKAISSAL